MPRERVAPPKEEAPPPPETGTLYAWCARTIASRDLEDPMLEVRSRLRLVAALLAKRRGENPKAWDVYVERHIAGVRFILRDATGREVDLEQLPADPRELS